MFSCKTKVTNTGKENISVTEVKGYYKNHGIELLMELLALMCYCRWRMGTSERSACWERVFPWEL